jgi:hypothetical protein
VPIQAVDATRHRHADINHRIACLSAACFEIALLDSADL